MRESGKSRGKAGWASYLQIRWEVATGVWTGGSQVIEKGRKVWGRLVDERRIVEKHLYGQRGSQRRQTTCSTLVNTPSVASKMSIWYKFEASRNAVLHMHVDIFFYCEIPRLHTKTGQYIMHFSQIVLSNKIIRSMLVWLYKKHISLASCSC